MLRRPSPASDRLLLGILVATRCLDRCGVERLEQLLGLLGVRGRHSETERPRPSENVDIQPGSNGSNAKGIPSCSSASRANWSVASKPPIAVCGPPLSAITTHSVASIGMLWPAPASGMGPKSRTTGPTDAAERLGCTPFGQRHVRRDLEQRGHHEVALEQPGVRQGQPVARALLFAEEQQVQVDHARALVEHPHAPHLHFENAHVLEERVGLESRLHRDDGIEERGLVRLVGGRCLVGVRDVRHVGLGYVRDRVDRARQVPEAIAQVEPSPM